MPDPALDFDAALLGLFYCDAALDDRDGGPNCPCNDRPWPCDMCKAQFEAYRENVARDMEKIGAVTARCVQAFQDELRREDGIINAVTRFRAYEGAELDAEGGVPCSICGIAVSPLARRACGTCLGCTGGAA